MSRILAACTAALTLMSAAGGCAHGPAVSSDTLPLKKVVVYRNGVAYFERAGTVDSDRVEFDVKPEHVGDFLATLSVVEHGGSSVRSASFPIELEEAEVARADGTEPPSPEPVKKSSLKRVVLELDGGKHDLRVGYVSEQPVWRPSYRLVFDESGPTLQAWGIIQNVSGEDWTNVSMSLVAGAPIAFESTLATPVTPRRPVVSDAGELISAVPRGENTLAQRPAPPPPPPMAAPPSDMGSGRADAAPKRKASKVPPQRGPAMPAPAAELPYEQEADAYAGVAPAAPPPSSMPRNLALLAATQVQAGATRYDLPQPVTVPKDSATMVLLVAKPVPGESVFMFAPDPGVHDSARHPFRVVRFKNDTPGLLERGPIAVIESGAFLGQGLLEPLAAGGEATVPFALERAVAIDLERKHEQREARLARVEASVLTVERDDVLRTMYRLRNGQDKAARVLLKHPRVPGTRLHEAPKGTEDRVGQQNALVPATVDALGTQEVLIDERRAYQQQVDWMSNWAEEAVKAYLADARADPKSAAALKEVWTLREDLRKTNQERSKVQSEADIVRNAAEETRQSLQALKRNTGRQVDDLRQKLAARLLELDKRFADLTQRSTELALRENELRIRFEDQLRDLKIENPLPAPKV
jgi:hypothetical protein